MSQIPPAAANQLAGIFDRLDAARIGAAAPHKGDLVPRAEFVNIAGDTLMLKSLYAPAPLILIFFRGRWCPFCDLTLRAFNSDLSSFRKLGASLVAVSPQTLEETALTSSQCGLSFPVLRDSDNKAAQSFGLSWPLDAGERAVHAALDIRLDKVNGDDRWELPAPAVFLIDKSGMVRYASVHSNWTVRTEPDEVLAELRALNSAPLNSRQAFC